MIKLAITLCVLAVSFGLFMALPFMHNLAFSLGGFGFRWWMVGMATIGYLTYKRVK